MPTKEIAMKTRRFGRTELQLTELGYGAMELRRVDTAQAELLLNNVLDAGINFIDTAPDYGASEEYIGKYIAHRRAEYILASKCGCNIPRDESDDIAHIWTRDQVVYNIEHSLELLKTDYLDLWQIHSATSEEVKNGGLVDAMREVRSQGKVRYIGYTAPGGAPRFALDDVVEMLSWDVFDFFQLPYCIVARVHEESIAAAARKDAGIILRGTVKPAYARVYEKGDWQKLWRSANLDELMAEGEDRYRFMLRFAISHPDYSTDIIGTGSLEHLNDNIETFEIGPLADDVYREAKARLDSVGVTALPLS
jgi:aryl-alcohol dehydrogenase-like predicted oxidoreductase